MEIRKTTQVKNFKFILILPYGIGKYFRLQI